MEKESSKGKVLIVDDDKNILFTLRMRLEYLGYQVITSTNALHGLYMAGSEKPDVILLDIKMPGMNGMEILESIKILSPSTKIIIMTACEDEYFRKMGIKNSYSVMRKPLSIPALDELIMKTLRSSGFLQNYNRKEVDQNVK